MATATPLPQIDVSRLKAALTSAKEKRPEATLRRADAALLTQQQNHRRAVEQVLRPFFTKAGLDIEKLDKMAAQNQKELRRILPKPEGGSRPAWIFGNGRDS